MSYKNLQTHITRTIVVRGEVKNSEFSMRVPAEPDRDADLVMSEAAHRLERQQAEIDRLRLAAVQAKRFITCYHWKDNPPSSGNWSVSGAGEVYEQLKEALKHD